jgi:hypothetical protein
MPTHSLFPGKNKNHICVMPFTYLLYNFDVTLIRPTVNQPGCMWFDRIKMKTSNIMKVAYMIDTIIGGEGNEIAYICEHC